LQQLANHAVNDRCTAQSRDLQARYFTGGLDTGSIRNQTAFDAGTDIRVGRCLLVAFLVDGDDHFVKHYIVCVRQILAPPMTGGKGLKVWLSVASDDQAAVFTPTPWASVHPDGRLEIQEGPMEYYRVSGNVSTRVDSRVDGDGTESMEDDVMRAAPMAQGILLNDVLVHWGLRGSQPKLVNPQQVIDVLG
jgi:hypothetical protein